MAQIDQTILLQRVHDALERQEKDSKRIGGPGGPTDGVHLESRVAKLESDVSHISSDISDIKIDIRELRKNSSFDFRLLFGAIITATLGLAYLMARGFHWL